MTAFGTSNEPIGDLEPEPLELASWEMTLGELVLEELPSLGADALVRGLDSPSLRLLAGQTHYDSPLDSRDLFVTALGEMGIEELQEADAAWRLIRLTASRIVAGTIDPLTGSEYIWRRSLSVEPNGDLRIFAGISSALDDDGADQRLLAREAAAAAKEFLERASPRRWLRLRADVAREPLEWTDTNRQSHPEVNPSALEISPDLAREVEAWNADFGSTMSGWPKEGGFASTRAAEAFVEAGRVLVSRLQEELGEAFVVEYLPEAIRPPGLKKRPLVKRLRRMRR